MRIGFIGADSKHVEFFGLPINKENFFGDTRVDYIWGGDTSKERLHNCAEEVEIEHIVDTPSEVIEKSDAIMITLRNGGQHLDYALECLKKKKPVFIDKPFTNTVKDANSIIQAAIQTGTPYTGGSTLCFLPEVDYLQNYMKSFTNAEISYRADPDSPFGGWYFYGSHLTDLYATICGTYPTLVSASRRHSEISVDLLYTEEGEQDFSNTNKTKKVRIFSAPDITSPTVTMDQCYTLNDKTCYNYGLKAFLSCIYKNTSPDGERLLFSVKLMDAIMNSLNKSVPFRID